MWLAALESRINRILAKSYVVFRHKPTGHNNRLIGKPLHRERPILKHLCESDCLQHSTDIWKSFLDFTNGRPLRCTSLETRGKFHLAHFPARFSSQCISNHTFEISPIRMYTSNLVCVRFSRSQQVGNKCKLFIRYFICMCKNFLLSQWITIKDATSTLLRYNKYANVPNFFFPFAY